MVKYKFCTHETEDCRPQREIKLWWCEATCGTYNWVVCYLDDDADLKDYWSDAFDIRKETI